MDTPPKIRDDLIIIENIKDDGSKYYVIKDPITNGFFKVGEPEYFIITNFDGVKSIPDIAVSFKNKFNVDLDEKTIFGFSEELQKLCFLDNDLTRKELLRRQRIASRDKDQSLLRKLVFIKLKAINPGRLFDSLIKYIGFFFTRPFVWVASLLMVFSFVITIYNSAAMAEGFAALFNLQGIIIIYLSLFIVIVLHEFAHGLTCTHYGGRVHDIGFLLLYFQPAFYCNVSDAWLFTDKSKRLWVSFSGGFFQLFIWAIAVIVWRVTALDTIINKIALATLSFSGIATLFNFNPLLRYDGYYLLSDYLEIPNLRKKAGRYWRDMFRKIFLGGKPESGNLAGREKRIYFYYGFLSFIYIVLVLGYFFLKAAQFLVSELGGTGFLIFAAIMVFLFRNIIMDAIQGTGEMIKARTGLFRRWTTWIIILAVVALFTLLIIFGRWELRIKGELVLNPLQSLMVKYNSTGYAELVQYDADNRTIGQQRQLSVFSGDNTTTRLQPLVGRGDSVKNGQVIARLVNSETSRLIDEYTARLQQAREELALLINGPRPQEIEQARNSVSEMEAQLKLSSQNLTRMNDMLMKKLISKQAWEDAQADSTIWDSRLKAAQSQLSVLMAGSRPEEIKAKEAEIIQLESQIESRSKQQESYEIKSPVNGMVLKTDTGETVLEIAKLDTMEAEITLSEKELADIASGQKVKFKVRGYPSLTFWGIVYRVENRVIADRQGDRVIQVSCRVPNIEHKLVPGMTGVANIYCGKRSIGYLIYRKFFRTIRTEFWDWFDWI